MKERKEEEKTEGGKGRKRRRKDGTEENRRKKEEMKGEKGRQGGWVSGSCPAGTPSSPPRRANTSPQPAPVCLSSVEIFRRLRLPQNIPCSLACSAPSLLPLSCQKAVGLSGKARLSPGTVGAVLLPAGSSEDAYLPPAPGVEADSGPTASAPEAPEKGAKAMSRDCLQSCRISLEQLVRRILGREADPSLPRWKALGECCTQLGLLGGPSGQLLEQDLGWLASWNGLELEGQGTDSPNGARDGARGACENPDCRLSGRGHDSEGPPRPRPAWVRGDGLTAPS